MEKTVLHRIQHIQRATLILIMGTLLVNLAGFAKSLLVAMYYGTSAELDAYFLSLTPIKLVLGILGATIQVALIPKYLELTVKKGKNHAFAVFTTFVGWILCFVITIAIAFWFGSPVIASYLGIGFTGSQIHLTTSFLRISAVLLILNLLNNIGLCLFYAHRQFVFPAFIPLLSSAISVGYLVYFHTHGVSVLIYGLIFGMVLQNCLVFGANRRFAPKRLSFSSPLSHDIREIVKSMSFLVIGASFGHVNVLVDQMMASTLPAGSIAALQYAYKLHNVLTNMFIIMVSKAVFPFFTQQVAENNIDAMKRTFWVTSKRMLVVLLPIACVIIVLGYQLVQIIFQRGAFSTHSASATAGAWIAYTLGLPIQAVGILAARMYNALQENKILMYVSGASIGLNILFNWIFMNIWGHIGIALSTSGVYIVATSVLLYILHKKIGKLWP